MSLSTLRVHVSDKQLLLNQPLDVLTKLRPISLWQELAVFGSSLFVVGSFFWVPVLLWWTLKRLKTRRARLIAVAVVALLMFAPVNVWPGARYNSLWRAWTAYFSPSIIVDGDELAPGKGRLFAFLPHGIYPFSQGIALVDQLNTFFGGLRLIASSVGMKFPVFRHLLGWVGAVEATKTAISSALKAGVSVQLSPGGVAEMYHNDAVRETVVLSSRKGFIKLALEHGYTLVPTFCFGNSQTLTLAPFSCALESFSRKLKLSLLVFWGRFFLPIPYRVPLVYVVGQQIEVPRTPSPSPQQVNELHAKFVAAVEHLFDKYKFVTGYGDKVLRIL